MNSSDPRPYRSELRSEQADLTRQRLAAAAVELFVSQGYAATPITAVATRAGVSAQTIYNAFGTKAALLKAAYDITLVGDAEQVPLAERDDVRVLYAEPDAATFLLGYARLGRELLDRVGPLMLQVAAGASAGDPDLVAHRATTDRERLQGTTMVARRIEELGALGPGVSVESARDRIWALNSVELWHLLTGTRGWTGEDYEEWVGEMMGAAVGLTSAR